MDAGPLLLLYLAMRGGFSGLARNTTHLVWPKHDLVQCLMGRAGMRPALGHAWALPQAR
jgi:hypothetical protein